MIKSLTFYKVINILLLILVVGVYFFVGYYLDGTCTDGLCLDYYQYAIYDPLSSGSFGLAIILGLLLFVPSDLFRKWFWYIAPWMILLTINSIGGVSVLSSGVISMSRSGVATIGMQLLGVITILYIGGHLLYYWWKKRNIFHK